LTSLTAIGQDLFAPNLVLANPVAASGPTIPPVFQGSAHNRTIANSSPSGNMTVGAGANRFLLLTVAVSGSTITVSSASFNGQACTKIGATTAGSGAGSINIEFWGLVAPVATFASFVVNFSSTPVESDVFACSYTGVDQTTPTRNFAGATATSSSPSVSLTSSSGEMIQDTLCWDTSGGFGPFETVGSGQVARDGDENGTLVYYAVSTRTPGAASSTMSWSLGSSVLWGIAAVSIRGL
jgi:hypothetical protein